MIPVKQTRVGKGGDGFRACVASVLELDLVEVPDFCNEEPVSEWFLTFCGWLRQFDLSAVMIAGPWDNKLQQLFQDVHVLAGGQSAVRPHPHKVVYFNGRLAHDPAPEGLGLRGEPKDFIVFVAREPQKAVRNRYLEQRYREGFESQFMCTPIPPDEG